MNKPTDYEQTEALSYSRQIKPGGYVCQLRKLKETTSASGRPMLTVALDVIEGEYSGIFKEIHENRTKYNVAAKWPCVMRQVVQNKDGATNRGFKTFCEDVVLSNKMDGVPWGERFCDELTGKVIGVLFRREEFLGKDRRAHWTVKPVAWKTVDEIRSGKFTIPKDKPLEDDLPEGYSYLDEDDVPF